MAHYMDNKESASLIGLAKNLVKFIQIFCMFYAFFTLVYWLLETSNVPGITDYAWLFQPMWDFVKLFYTYKAKSQDELIDFTGVISAICLILMSNTVKSLYEVLNNVEHSMNLQKAKKAKNIALNGKPVAPVKKSAKDLTSFIFILDVKITNLSNFIQEEKMTPEAMDRLKTKFHEALLNNINQNQITQKGLFKKKLYLIYKEFDYIDNFIFYTRETLNSLSREFSKPTLRIDFLVALGCLGQNDDLNTEINILDTIICLNLQNEFISTSAFKRRYDDRQKKQYRLVTKGVYNLSKNLNVTNNQEIYSLRENA